MVLMIPFLCINTYTDLKDQKISKSSLLLFLLLRFFVPLTEWGKECFKGQEEGLWMYAAGAGFGLLLLLLAFATEGAFGIGDGLAGIVLGLYLGLYRVLFLFMGGCFLAGIWGSVLLIRKKAGRKSRLPLIPFLLPAGLILLVMGRV